MTRDLTPHYRRRRACASLGLVYVKPGVFTPEQARQIEAWRKANEADIQREEGQ